MAEVTHLSCDCTVEDIVSVVEENGAVIVDDFVSQKWLEEFNTQVQTSVDEYEPYDYGGREAAEFMGYQTVRIGGLISKAPCYADLISAFELPPFFRSAPDEGVPIGQLSGWAETGQAAIGAFPADAARYVEMSPLFSAADLRAPALLIESDLERPRMGKLFGVLYRLNRDAALLTYYGEGHVLASPGNLRDLHAHILDWLARYLGPATRDPTLPVARPGLQDGGQQRGVGALAPEQAGRVEINLERRPVEDALGR